MRISIFLLLLCAVFVCGSTDCFTQANSTLPDTAKAQHKGKKARAGDSTAPDLPPGIAKVWKDRGKLTPTRVYWGSASLLSNPLSRLPAPPFSRFKKDKNHEAWSPKAKLTDSKNIEWTIKLGAEAHADVAAPRLAWALGFGTVEGYYVGSGRIQGIDAKTDIGKAKDWIKPDGSFRGGARFKRHNKEAREIQDAKGHDLTWDEAQNPGVPPEHLSGLLLFDVMVHNWDAQPKNCKVLHVEGANGPENWFIVGDMGASFADKPKHKFVLSEYQKETSFIKSVSSDTVELNFSGIKRSEAKKHQKIPLAHAQWFRKLLAKLTDAEIQAAFDAAFATDALNRAYASGDAARIKAARARELSAETRREIAGFVAIFRAKIREFLQKIPVGKGLS